MSGPPRSPVHARSRRNSPLLRWLLLLLGAALLHLLAGLVVLLTLAGWRSLQGLPPEPEPPLQLVMMEQPPEPEPEPEAPVEPPPDLDGQLVELPEPEVEQPPEEAQYLAEHNSTVPEETRTEEFRINPEVVAPTFSEQDVEAAEAIDDVQAEDESSGATVGNDRFDPDRNGSMASLPSRFRATNMLGDEAPTTAVPDSAALSGAPQNDLLREEVGDRLQLNANEYIYASYFAKIRRAINTWWERNLMELRHAPPVGLENYTTTVDAVISRDGHIVDVTVTRTSNVREFDEAVTRAYVRAAPFPAPPDGLVDANGQVRLPTMHWTVQTPSSNLGANGVDPRAGVLYPGLHKGPR